MGTRTSSGAFPFIVLLLAGLGLPCVRAGEPASGRRAEGAGEAERPVAAQPGGPLVAPWERRRDLRIEQLRDEDGRVPPGVLLAARAFRDAMPKTGAARSGLLADPQTVPGSSWVNLGPSSIHLREGNLWSGRVNSITFDRSDPSSATLYIAAGEGGAWKSTSAGDTWRPLTDFQASTKISSVTLDPENPLIVYAATGDYDGNPGVWSSGFGLLRSRDGGLTWDPPLGVTHFASAEIVRVVPDPTHVADPLTQRVLHAAHSGGISYSTDGGKSWALAQYWKDGAYKELKCVGTEIVMDPLSASNLYAGCRKGSGALDAEGVFKSTDGGRHYTRIVDEAGALPPAKFGRVELAVSVDRTGTPRTVVFASMEEYGTDSHGAELKGIYRSDNGGASWYRLTGHPWQFADGGFRNANVLEQENNDTPAAANYVTDWIAQRRIVEGQVGSAGDVDVFRFTAGGDRASLEILAWRANASPRLAPRVRVLDDTGQAVNVASYPMNDKAQKDLRMRFTMAPGRDYYVEVAGEEGTSGRYQLSLVGTTLECQCGYDQVLAPDPDDPNVLFVGLVSLFRTTDGGRTFFDYLGHPSPAWNYTHADVHELAFDPSDATHRTIWLGCDGGMWRSTDLGDTWYPRNPPTLSINMISYGAAQHPQDPDMMLFGTQDDGTLRYDGREWWYEGDADGGYAAIVDGGTWYQSSQESAFRKRDAAGKHAWTAGLDNTGTWFIAPLVMDPNAPHTLLTPGGERVAPQVVHHYLYRTANAAAPEWARQGSEWFDATAMAIAVAPSDSRTYYFGTWNGKVWGTHDTGEHWTELTAGWAARPDRYVADVAVHPREKDTIYVAYPGTQAGLHVMRKRGWTAAWEDVTPRLPNGTLMASPALALAVDPTYPDTVFLGTIDGVYRTIDGGGTWTDFSNGLPSVQVNDLVLAPDAGPTGVLRAFTWGRGVWDLAPGNAFCADATAISDGTFTGSTTKAGADGGAKCGVSSDNPDVYYRYEARCDGRLEVDTCGSGYDSVLSLHDACPATSQNQVYKGCSDNCGAPDCPNDGCLELDVTQGHPYVIRVSGAGTVGNAGPYELHVRCRVPNDVCHEAQVVEVPSSTWGSTRGAGIDNAPACGGVADAGTGVWYRVIGTGNTMSATLCGFDVPRWDARLSVYCGECAELSCVAANDDGAGCPPLPQVSWCSKPGAVYWLLVHGNPPAENTFQLYVSDDGQPCTSYACGSPNPTCEERLPTKGEWGDNTGAGTDRAVTCATSNSDAWYEYAPACHGDGVFSTCYGTLRDSVLSIHEDCGDELTCNDDRAPGDYCSEVSLPLSPDYPRAIRVAGYGAGLREGTFRLDVTESPARMALPWPGLYTVDGAGAWEGWLARLDPFYRTADRVGPLGSPAATGIAALAYAPDLGRLYAIDDTAPARIATIDPDHGGVTYLRAAPYAGVRALTWDPQRLLLLGVTDGTLVLIDPVSGTGRVVGATGFPGIEALALDPGTRRLFAADAGLDALLELDLRTGAGTVIGGFGGAYGNVEGLAFDTVERRLYGIDDRPDGTGVLVEIDTATGAVRQERGAHASLGPRDLAFVPSLPDGAQGVPYKGSVPLAGGCPGYEFQGASGVPDGLQLDGLGRVAGTPSAVVSEEVTFDVRDEAGTMLYGAVAPLRVRPHNDLCPDMLPAYEGDNAFTTLNAGTDGPGEPSACNFFGNTQVGADVWFCHEATHSGSLIADTCSAGYDTRLAAYAGCGCPSAAAALACSDDSCGVGSRIVVPVTTGGHYLLRVGGFDEARGAGTLHLAYDGSGSGACCREAGCVVSTRYDCQEAGGTYYGDGSRCEDGDTDGDRVPDACDACPLDPQKTLPGACGCNHPDRDTDGDGQPDCADEDSDGDGVVNARDADPYDPSICQDDDADGCDDCALRAGADPAHDGDDADGDGRCATYDCDDADPSAWSLPKVSNLGFVPGSRTSLRWDAEPGATSVAYALYREPFPLGPGTVYDCVQRNLPATTATDAAVPPPGGAFGYLVAGHNRCGDGGIGAASDGTARRPGRCP